MSFLGNFKRLLKKAVPGSLLKGYYKRRRPHYLLPNEQLSFEVHLAEHCNLNCAGCNHFSPLAEPEFADPAALGQDFARLAGLFNGRISGVRLLGGEPLLHPDISGCLRITRSHFPQSAISVVTNGLLLSSQKEAFWLACRENQISVMVTRYPVKLAVEQLSDLAGKNSVEIGFSGKTPEDVRNFTLVPLDLSGRRDKDLSFVMCNRANACVALSRGRLFPCSTAAFIGHFNKFFQTNLAPGPEDGIDIYEARSADEILSFLARPIPFCRFCDLRNKRDGLGWQVSRKSLAEWTG